MEYKILASGSRGNCTIIKSNDSLLMIDCGIPKKELYDKLFEDGLTVNDFSAVLITHEHIDHIRSICEIKHNRLYGAKDTLDFDKENILEPYQEYEIAGFKVLPISTSHDCKNPCGYVIKDDKETMVYITDTGYVKEKDYQYLTNAEHYIFESNYDPGMLLDSNRPFFLKQRIMSMHGHLSNEASANILAHIIGDKTKSIRLAHISEDCNRKEIAYRTLIEALDSVGIVYSNISIEVADRYDVTKGM